VLDIENRHRLFVGEPFLLRENDEVLPGGLVLRGLVLFVLDGINRGRFGDVAIRADKLIKKLLASGGLELAVIRIRRFGGGRFVGQILRVERGEKANIRGMLFGGE
jgi:hypothetical protein